MSRRSIESRPDNPQPNDANIEKPSRLIAANSDDGTVGTNSSRKNKSLLGATDEEEHISPDTCDSYEYVRDMSRIMPDISLSEMRVNPFVRGPCLNRRQKLKVSKVSLELKPQLIVDQLC